MRYMYPAIFTENELDGYSVQFVDFENGYTCGDDMEDAVAMAAEVLWLLIDDTCSSTSLCRSRRTRSSTKACWSLYRSTSIPSGAC